MLKLIAFFFVILQYTCHIILEEEMMLIQKYETVSYSASTTKLIQKKIYKNQWLLFYKFTTSTQLMNQILFS